MKKITPNKYPINDLVKKRWSPRAFSEKQIEELVKKRWSPRAFSEKQIEEEKLASLFEAARWAPSAFNEQSWRFIIGQKGSETYDKILQSLVEWNQQWAGKSPVLVLNIASKNFSHNGKPNATAQYDLGQAVAFMLTEAVNQGLVSHEMSGSEPSEALQQALVKHVRAEIGAIAAPDLIQWAPALPKTRSGKIIMPNQR